MFGIDNKDENNQVEEKVVGGSIEKAEEPVKAIEPQPIKSIDKFEICKINYIKNNKVSVDFKGYGILINLGDNVHLDSNDKTLKVYYSSDIGKSDFKFWIDE